MAGFLRALHLDAPAEAPANPARGMPLRTLTRQFDEQFQAVASLVSGDVRGIWEDAVSAPDREGPPVWLHGDLRPANVVVSDGTLSGVIDFGELRAGGPATDLAAAWQLLPAGATSRFLDAYAEADASMIRRARGWAVLQALSLVGIGQAGEHGLPGGKPTWGHAGRATLDRLLVSGWATCTIAAAGRHSRHDRSDDVPPGVPGAGPRPDPPLPCAGQRRTRRAGDDDASGRPGRTRWRVNDDRCSNGQTGWKTGEIKPPVRARPAGGITGSEHFVLRADAAEHAASPGVRNESDRIEWIPPSELRGMIDRREIVSSGAGQHVVPVARSGRPTASRQPPEAAASPVVAVGLAAAWRRGRRTAEPPAGVPMFRGRIGTGSKSYVSEPGRNPSAWRRMPT